MRTQSLSEKKLSEVKNSVRPDLYKYMLQVKDLNFNTEAEPVLLNFLFDKLNKDDITVVYLGPVSLHLIACTAKIIGPRGKLYSVVHNIGSKLSILNRSYPAELRKIEILTEICKNRLIKHYPFDVVVFFGTIGNSFENIAENVLKKGGIALVPKKLANKGVVVQIIQKYADGSIKTAQKSLDDCGLKRLRDTNIDTVYPDFGSVLQETHTNVKKTTEPSNNINDLQKCPGCGTRLHSQFSMCSAGHMTCKSCSKPCAVCSKVSTPTSNKENTGGSNDKASSENRSKNEVKLEQSFKKSEVVICLVCNIELWACDNYYHIVKEHPELVTALKSFPFMFSFDSADWEGEYICYQRVRDEIFEFYVRFFGNTCSIAVRCVADTMKVNDYRVVLKIEKGQKLFFEESTVYNCSVPHKTLLQVPLFQISKESCTGFFENENVKFQLILFQNSS